MFSLLCFQASHLERVHRHVCSNSHCNSLLSMRTAQSPLPTMPRTRLRCLRHTVTSRSHLCPMPWSSYCIERHFMSHRMQAIFPAKFAGTALTVKLVKQENNDPDALSGMLRAIDLGGAGSVYVMQVEDGADVAGMGGLMGTAMYARSFAGAVIDGGVRDLAQLKKTGFPVYALGPVPSTAVGHYKFAGMNIPIKCDGIDVMPGDVVVADLDGIAVVPHAKAADILVLSQKLDNTEHLMYPFIEKFHSIVEAVKQFGRI